MSAAGDGPAQPEVEPPESSDDAERLPAEIEPALLRTYFSLTRADLDEVERCRGSANKLGFSVQLCVLRWRGHFLPDTREVPAAVLAVLAAQLGLLPMVIADYPRDEKTRFTHLERIRRYLGFVRCDRAQRELLLDHLTAVARSAPRTEALRRAAHTWLLAQRGAGGPHAPRCALWSPRRARPASNKRTTPSRGTCPRRSAAGLMGC